MVADFQRENVTGDLLVEDGNFKLVRGRPAVGQFLGVRLSSIVGDWYLNLLYGGIDRDVIFAKPVDLTAVGAVRKLAIQDVPGVLSILEYDPTFNPTTRGLSEVIRVLTEEGDLVEEVSLNAQAEAYIVMLRPTGPILG